MKSHQLLFCLCMTFVPILKAQTVNPLLPDNSQPRSIPGYTFVWGDEFNVDGKPNPAFWNYENGFVRNEELQWYQSANANVKDGVLLIEGKRETIANPNYVAGSTHWKTSRQYAYYTSASIKTNGKVSFKFGRIEVRARIDTRLGSWPAIWTLGNSGEWPSCGEVDIMEFYRINGVPSILANTAWGTATRWVAKWNGSNKPLSYFTNKDPEWRNKFHIWRMDWDEHFIKLYLDDELLNTTNLSNTKNAAGVYPANPFLQKHYFLLNLAIGSNGGNPANTTFPMKYEVDYIRVWQKDETPNDSLLNKKDWKLISVSSEDIANGATNTGNKAFDGLSSTMWHSQWSPTAVALPHHITIDLGDTARIYGFKYLPRQDGNLNGTIADYDFFAGVDYNNFETAVITGKFSNNANEKNILLLDTLRARYIKLVAKSEINGKSLTSVSELNLYGYYEKDKIESGLINNFAENPVKIYPNPINGRKLNVDLPIQYPSNGKMMIFDLSGIKVFEKELLQQKNLLDIDLNKGMYLINVQHEKMNTTQKLSVD